MNLHLYDSATRSLRAFVPLDAGKVGIYLCGATVQGSPHIGHVRAAVAFDVLVRWLRRCGQDVTMIRNVTDIDDKILAKSAEAGAPWWAWAYRFEQEFTAAYDALGVLRPSYEPRATGHIPEMIALVELLVARGHAYAGQSGNVYFDVRSLDSYGSLTRQALENMAPEDEAAAGAGGDKRDPRDFALWKAPRPGEPETASWPTPWGTARPGWHLECSAMARRYLGESFDIHAGGLDLRFPHHENEQAQSHAAGYGFARHWLHNAWVTTGGEKMSKSLGNSLQVAHLLGSVPSPVLRYALGTVHYRSTIEYTDTTAAEAAAVWQRLSGFVQRAAEQGEVDAAEIAALGPADLPEAFVAAMDDDLNVSVALAAIHEQVRLGNNALAEGDGAAVRSAQLQVRAMLDVLGLDPLAEPWRETVGGSGTGSGRERQALDALVQAALAERAEARAAKDFARADALRDRLTTAGIVVEDSPAGARWSLGGPS
ncbi:cysteine--tRNA ligase [Bogoriella caseilytica]|uniref:Cysteine--tRNA ligase n=1 Tax=Bogoriella caseilytica TaxID=56055 RepID=A0A3N2BDB4_9MICO|nr:cysteine--tRNA ligase [Bogoriella caseilytica]ROR73250.1 cysteinyl-tRNA synthetase [Bogoriella caseilytica]